MDDSYETNIPPEILGGVLDVCVEFEVDPTASDDAERFMMQLVDDNRITDGSIDWESVRTATAAAFRWLKKRPEWVQNPEWRFYGGRPMMFVGQEEVALRGRVPFTIYLFCEEHTGQVETVVQYG